MTAAMTATMLLATAAAVLASSLAWLLAARAAVRHSAVPRSARPHPVQPFSDLC